MKKIKIGAEPYMYPMPTVLVGTNVNNKANYRTIAFCGMVQVSPPVIAVALGKDSYTGEGIKETGGFSVNIPSDSMVKITDYCGIVSGKDVDKSALFKPFYGQLGNVPMIEECPVSLECKLVKVIDVGGDHEIYVGEIVQTYCNEDVIKDEKPDLELIKPILFTFGDNKYWKTGECMASAWDIGRKLEG